MHRLTDNQIDDSRVLLYVSATPKNARVVRDWRYRIPSLVCEHGSPVGVLLVFTWRYPRTFKTLLTILKMYRAIQEHDRQALYKQYPAHLHINLLPGYQGLGLGTELIHHFEEHMIRQGAWGLNLSTTNYNRKAVPFYEKLGFSLHQQIPFKHPTLANFQELTYVKGLKQADSHDPADSDNSAASTL